MFLHWNELKQRSDLLSHYSLGFKLKSQFVIGPEFWTKFFLAKNRLRKVEHREFDFSGGLTHCKARQMKHMSTSMSSQWLRNQWSIKFLRIVDLLLELCTRKCTVTKIHVFLSSIVIRQDRMHGLCVHVEWLCGIEWICDNDDIVRKTDISKYIDKFSIKSRPIPITRFIPVSISNM